MGKDRSQHFQNLQVMPLDGRVFVAWFGFKKNNSGKLLKGSHTICKLCKQKVVHGGGTTDLKNHLQMKHHLTYDELFAKTCWRLRANLILFVVQSVKKVPFSLYSHCATDIYATLGKISATAKVKSIVELATFNDNHLQTQIFLVSIMPLVTYLLVQNSQVYPKSR